MRRHCINRNFTKPEAIQPLIFFPSSFEQVVKALHISPEVLAKIAVVGWCTSWFWRGDRISFEEMFYGDWSYHNFSLVRHVGFGQLTIVLLAGC